MSMEEEQARQAAAAGSAQPSSSSAPAAAPAAAPAQPAVPAAAAAPVEDEEAMLQRALALSQGQDVDMADHAGGEEESEEDAIKRAIEMSMKGHDQQQ